MYPQRVCRIRKAPSLPTAAQYFKFFKAKLWDKRSVKGRSSNGVSLPYKRTLGACRFPNGKRPCVIAAGLHRGTCRGLDCQRGEELLKLCMMQRQAPNTCRSRQKIRAANEPHGYNTPDMMCSFGCGRGTGPAWLSADLTYRPKDASQ